MNCASTREHHALELVDIIDFKWLMAHQGHHVHVERLQTDRRYASECLAMAQACTVPALHVAAIRLSQSLGVAIEMAPATRAKM
jgi:hypothetical protein